MQIVYFITVFINHELYLYTKADNVSSRIKNMLNVVFRHPFITKLENYQRLEL